MIGNFMDRGNQCKQLIEVLYCNLPTIGKKLPTFPHRAQGLNFRPKKWEARVLPLPHCGPQKDRIKRTLFTLEVKSSNNINKP